jgi:hypothetical protein
MYKDFSGNMGAPGRAFRSNLFCGRAAKKDFRCNPLRPRGFL